MFQITSSKEYWQKIRVSLNDLSQMYTAQRSVYIDGFEDRNFDKCMTVLGGVSTVLGILFLAPTAVAVVGGVSGLISALGSGLNNLESLVDSGSLAIADAENWLYQNPQYDLIEIKYPFLEYDDAVDNESIRFVQASGPNSWEVTAVHVKGGSGWQILD